MKDKFNNAVGPQVRVDKTNDGLLIPVLAVVFILAGLQSSTQYFANEFGYQIQLGTHYQHIYAPWCVFRFKVATYSRRMLPPIPFQSCH